MEMKGLFLTAVIAMLLFDLYIRVMSHPTILTAYMYFMFFNSQSKQLIIRNPKMSDLLFRVNVMHHRAYDLFLTTFRKKVRNRTF